MKIRLLFLVLSLSVSISYGQIAKWLILPKYDKINPVNGELFVADSLGTKVIWSKSGKRLASTEDDMSSYSEGLAVTKKRENNAITGFYNKTGEFTPLKGNFYPSDFDLQFSDGYLLVRDSSFYRFINSKGEACDMLYATAYPYINGYAKCEIYKNIKKQKGDTYRSMISKNGEQVVFSYNGDEFKEGDVDYVSSVNDEGIGIVVAKRKLYYFNGINRSLSPIYARKGETIKKNQAKLEKDLSFYNESDSIKVLEAKSGKSDKVRIRFNSMDVPVTISLVDGDYIYKKTKQLNNFRESPLKIIKNKEKYGLVWENKEILPPQLDDIEEIPNGFFIARVQGKVGVLQILENANFKISINKDNPVGFKHQKFETTIKLDLPKEIPSQNARILIDPKSGCEVDLRSGENKDTEFGNYIQYDCVLSIPDSLPDDPNSGDGRNEIIYLAQILYDGLESPIMQLKVQAWHRIYFNVELKENTIRQGDLSFILDINDVERTAGEAIFPWEVKVQADTLMVEMERVSEKRYKCKVYSLSEGDNNIIVQILEAGCPPMLFPFEVTYTKPKSQTRAKEGIIIKKKTRRSHTPSPIVPSLNI